MIAAEAAPDAAINAMAASPVLPRITIFGMIYLWQGGVRAVGSACRAGTLSSNFTTYSTDWPRQVRGTRAWSGPTVKCLDAFPASREPLEQLHAHQVARLHVAAVVLENDEAVRLGH